jgi:hypothetical protein
MSGSEQDAHHSPAPTVETMMGRYIKMVEEHLRKVVASHQRDWDVGLPVFLLANRSSSHDITGLTPLSLCSEENSDCPATCCLGHPRQESTHNRSRGRLSGPSTRHPQLCPPKLEAGQWPAKISLRQNSQLSELPWVRQSVALSPNPHEDEIALLQTSWEGPYKVVTRINDVVYRVQRNPISKLIVVHLDRLAPYQGAAWDELP